MSLDTSCKLQIEVLLESHEIIATQSDMNNSVVNIKLKGSCLRKKIAYIESSMNIVSKPIFLCHASFFSQRKASPGPSLKAVLNIMYLN